MYKILCYNREKMRFNQVAQIEDMRFETLEFAKKGVELLSRLFPETVFELLDLDEYSKRQEDYGQLYDDMTPQNWEAQSYCHVPGDEG